MYTFLAFWTSLIVMAMASSQPLSDDQIEESAHLDWYSGFIDVLDEDEPGDVVRVLGPGRERLEIDKSEAIAVLRAVFDDQQSAQQRFDLLLATCGAWIVAHRDRIESAWLTRFDEKFKLVIVQTAEERDAELHQSLSELWLRLGQDRHLRDISFDTLLLPPVSGAGLRTFVNAKFLLQYRAIDRTPTVETASTESVSSGR